MTPEILNIKDEVPEWDIKLPGGVRTKTKKFGVKIFNQPVIHGKKRKNGCRLVSTDQVRRSTKESLKGGFGHKMAFPPMPL